MIHSVVPRLLGRGMLSALLAYVLALQLVVLGLASAAHAARRLDPLANLDPHALCLTGPGAFQDHGSPSGSDGSSGQHDLCCSFACRLPILLAPVAFVVAAGPFITAFAASAPAGFGARLPAIRPGQGRGPRAPPSDLA